MKKVFITVFMIFSMVTLVSAQDTVASASVEEKLGAEWMGSVKVRYGVILAHRPTITNLTYQHVYGMEGGIEKSFYQGSPLSFGFAGMFINYRNPIIGKEFGTVAYFKQYLLRQRSKYPFFDGVWERRRTGLGLRLGAGIGYFTNTFDRSSNHENLVISSHINGVLQGALFFEHQQFSTSITFTHASNGAFKMPNLGVNVLSLDAGYRFGMGKTSPVWGLDASHEIYDKGVFFETGIGVREVFPTGGKKYLVNTLSVGGYINVSKITAFTIALDAMYNRALIQEQIKEGISPNDPTVFQMGLAPGVEFDIGHLSGTVQYGYVFFMPFKWEGRTYSKLGLKYAITKQFFTGIRLKANGGKADFVEWTFHYKI